MKTPPIKVLHLMNALMPSGMEMMLVSAAPYFHTQGVKSIVVGQGTSHPFEADLSDVGYKVERIPSLSTRAGRGEWRRLLRSTRPDIVHVHSERSYLLTVLATWGALPGVPIVRTVHSVFDAHGKWKARRQFQAVMGDRLVSAVVACSPDVARNETKFHRTCDVIFNWVDDRYFETQIQRKALGRDVRSDLVVMVGNCGAIKQHELALRAIRSTKASVAHFGNEDHISDAERDLLDELAQEQRLVHRGVGDPSVALREATLFVMPSRHEGMGVSAAEAIVVGVPALLNDVQGLRWARDLSSVQLIENSQSAWNDAVASSLSRQLGESAAPALTVGIDFRASRGAREYGTLYREILRGRSQSRRQKAQ